VFQVIWNCRDPLFEDVNVRRAMGLAFNHEEMLEKTLFNVFEPASGPFHPTSWMSPQPPAAVQKQDQDRAQQLLDEAGWSDSDGDGVLDRETPGGRLRFEFTMLINERPVSRDIAALWKECLADIGIVCNIKVTEFAQLTKLVQEHKFQASMGGWGTGTDPDTTENIFSTKAIDGQRNYGCYSNAEVDRLYEQGKLEFDPTKRAAIYARIATILQNEQPYTWLYYRNSFYGFNRGLRGYRFSPRGPFTYNPGFRSVFRAAAVP
jgi:peptide/nickel transport system substrate-binding protein